MLGTSTFGIDFLASFSCWCFSHYWYFFWQPKGGKVWLLFRGINYQAEVFVNGHKKLLSKGMFLRHTLDITDWVNPNGHNFLAVVVYPPDHPGKIPLEGGQGGDHDVRFLTLDLSKCASNGRF